MSSDISYIDPDLVNGKTIPVLDVRRHRHGEQIRGAVHYDARKLREAGKLVLPLPHDTPIAVYSDDDESAQTIVAALVASGYNAAILNGGIEEWKRRGYATEAATQINPSRAKTLRGFLASEWSGCCGPPGIGIANCRLSLQRTKAA